MKERAAETFGEGSGTLSRQIGPAAAMFLGVVASTGEVGPVFGWPGGYRLNADGYVNALPSKIIPWMRETAAAHRNSFVFQQDSAPAHIARKTNEACCNCCPNVATLKWRVNAAWRCMDPAKICAVICSAFRKRIKKCIKLEGKTF